MTLLNIYLLLLSGTCISIHFNFLFTEDKKSAKEKEKKKKKEAKEKKKGPDRKLKPNPRIKVLEKDPFFETK